MNIKQTIAILIILISASTLVFSAGQKQSGPAPITETGVLSYLEGDVLINNNPANIGDMVNSSDTVKTGEDSYCEVVFGKSNVFRLDENTETRIDWSRSDVQLKKGSVSAVFTKLDKFINGEKDFTLSTPIAVAGVRGTVFFIKVEDDNNTYLCICNGKLNVEGPESDLEIASAHHKAYRFTKKGSIVETSSAALLYHDDEKMEGVASSVEYKIPWDMTEDNY